MLQREDHMNQEQFRRMREDKGFIAALDQSGGSTPKALKQYGIPETAYSGDEEMFNLVHAMRERIITNPAFSGDHILGAILFEKTMDGKISGEPAADYLWNKKKIIPILKVDKGLEELRDGVQLMKPMPALDALLDRALKANIFGTKMRSVIKDANPKGIAAIVDQQFEVGIQIAKKGLIPILEPEVDIKSPDRKESEDLLKKEVKKHLDALDGDVNVMFKFTIPVQDNLYADLLTHPRVVRIVALSGGFTQAEANEKLARNKGLIASFSRALLQGLSANQTEEEFTKMLRDSVEAVYKASIT